VKLAPVTYRTASAATLSARPHSGFSAAASVPSIKSGSAK
jgi:hypothetical protein